MHPNDEMALKNKRVYLYFFLIVILILAGLCCVWALGSIYSSFTEKSEQLTKIEEQFSQYYHKRFPLNEDTENPLTFDEMLKKIIQDDDSISSNAQRLRNEKNNISRAQFKVKEEKEKLWKEITCLQGFFMKNFDQNLDKQGIAAIKNRIGDLEARVRKLQSQYQTLAEEEQNIRRLLNTYRENIFSLYVSLGGRGKPDTNDRINFIKAKVKEFNRGVQSPPKTFSSPQKTSQTQLLTVPAKELLSKKQTSPRKCLRELKYKVIYHGEQMTQKYFGLSEKMEIIKLDINCDRHNPNLYEVIINGNSITQLYNTQTKERIHFYVYEKRISKDDIVNYENNELHVRTSPSKTGEIFMTLPSGVKIQRAKNNSQHIEWIEIEFPTKEMYFVLEQ